MLFVAFAAGAAGVASGSTMLALLAGCGVSLLLSWLHGFACVSHRGDQVISGMAINIIASGLTAVLAVAWFNQGGQTPPLPSQVRLHEPFPSLSPAPPPLPLIGPGLAAGAFGRTP